MKLGPVPKAAVDGHHSDSVLNLGPVLKAESMDGHHQHSLVSDLVHEPRLLPSGGLSTIKQTSEQKGM